MTRSRIARSVLLGAFVASSGALAATPARAPGLKAMQVLQAGKWEFRATGAKAPDRHICLPDATAIIQYRHRHAQCSRFVIENSARQATVHYTCPGEGHGRTTMRVETPRHVTVETQGVASGQPFQIQLDGQRVSECG